MNLYKMSQVVCALCVMHVCICCRQQLHVVGSVGDEVGSVGDEVGSVGEAVGYIVSPASVGCCVGA